MNSRLYFILISALLPMVLASCKQDVNPAADPAVLLREIDRLTIISDALLFPQDPVARLTRKDERAKRIEHLRTLLSEEAKRESDAYIRALKANPGSVTTAPIPPIRFAKPSGHAYFPELTNLEIEQLKKVTGELQQFFAARDNTSVFLHRLRDCNKVLDAQPALDRMRFDY